MIGEELFTQMGKVEEEFILEAEQYQRNSLWNKYRKQLLPLAASVCLCILSAAKNCFL